MKRFLLLTLAAITMLMASAKHLTFQNIPIDGSLSTFCGKLVNQKGCTVGDRDSNVWTLTGPYAGYSDVEYYVFSNDAGNTYRIDLYLPKCSSWSQIKRQYDKTVKNFRADTSLKFDEDKAEFESPYRVGDGNEVDAIKEDKCNYFTYFVGDGGLIKVSISKFMQVKISFIDANNYPDDSSSSSSSSSSGSTTNYSNDGTAMQFMGIPMRGNFKSFAQQLVNQKGCTLVSTDEHVATLSGKFTGKEAEFYVFGTEASNQVYAVVIYLPKKSTWSAIKDEYIQYKHQFDNKYTLTNSYDFFADPYDEGDGKEVEGVKADKCHYSSFYNAPGGSIMLKISKYMQVQIRYEDNNNVQLDNNEEISNDI